MTKSDLTGQERVILILRPEDIVHSLLAAKLLARKAGFNETLQSMIGAVVSELATNIIRYAENGTIILKIIQDNHGTVFELKAVDHGPGIVDVEKAFEDNYSTTRNSLGMGLPSVKRIMDEYSVDSKINIGTTIIARKWRT